MNTIRSFFFSNAFVGTILIWAAQFFFIQNAYSQVWPHHPGLKWNQNFETLYSNWIQNQIEENWLLSDSNPLSKLSYRVGSKLQATDCADFAYVLRLYFSSLHGLEFSIANSNIKISSLDKRFNHIKDLSKRLRAFAELIIAHVDTSTLNDDTGLVPLQAPHLRPGVIVLADRYRRHTWILKSVSMTGMPHLIYRDMDDSYRVFRSYYFPPVESIFTKGYLSHQTGGGIRAFRWPEELGKSHDDLVKSTQDRFSNDQYRISISQLFTKAIEANRKAPASLNEDIMNRLDDLCSKVRERTNIVTDAAHLKFSKGKISGLEFDRLSTPSRDRDIRSRIHEIDQLIAKHHSKLEGQVRIAAASFFENTSSTNTYCLVAIGETSDSAGRTRDFAESLGAIAARFRSVGQISSDPNDDLASRWGLK